MARCICRCLCVIDVQDVHELVLLRDHKEEACIVDDGCGGDLR